MKVHLLLLLAFMISINNLYGQAPYLLFQPIDTSDKVLNAKEVNRFQSLENEHVIEKTLIDISGLNNVINLTSAAVLLNGNEYDVKKMNLSQSQNTDFKYRATFFDEIGEIYLYRTNGYLYGNVHLDSLSYQIEPINDRYAVLLRRDYSNDRCEIEIKDEVSNRLDSGLSRSKTLFSTSTVIDVMVLFSNQAAAATSNMQALAQASIQSSNDTFANSNVGVSFNLVHYQQVNYNDSGSSLTDVNRLQGTSDGYIDNIHSLRNQYGADVVMLIVANTDACGRVYSIGGNSNEAFAISEDGCSVGNYTFAHEVGHIAGARHDNDPASSPYAYGHGFKYTPAFWRTVMATNAGSISTNRIPYWSNPNIYYGGIAMGTTSWNDNARVWDVRAAVIASFKTPPAPGPSAPTGVTITNAGSTIGSPVIDWNDNPESDIDHYEIWRQKKRMIDGYVFPFALLATSTASTYTDNTVLYGNPADYNWRYAIKAVNTSNETSAFSNATIWISGFTFIKVTSTSTIPETFALNNNYPNPFNPSTKINFELPEASDVSIKIYNIMGQEVALLIEGDFSEGSHEVIFEADRLPSGFYIAQMNATGQSGSQFVKQIKMQLVK